jgi:hypothetical protein
MGPAPICLKISARRAKKRPIEGYYSQVPTHLFSHWSIPLKFPIILIICCYSLLQREESRIEWSYFIYGWCVYEIKNKIIFRDKRSLIPGCTEEFETSASGMHTYCWFLTTVHLGSVIV